LQQKGNGSNGNSGGEDQVPVTSASEQMAGMGLNDGSDAYYYPNNYYYGAEGGNAYGNYQYYGQNGGNQNVAAVAAAAAAQYPYYPSPHGNPLQYSTAYQQFSMQYQQPYIPPGVRPSPGLWVAPTPTTSGANVVVTSAPLIEVPSNDEMGLLEQQPVTTAST
jgi:hypothetical protein